jgi:glycosyltransferase involved in cell wall biosynthesis
MREGAPRRVGEDETHGIKPLSIIHVVSSLETGGMERVVLGLASAQQAAGHPVSILALRGGPLQREAESRRLRVHTLSGGRVSRTLGAVRYLATEQAAIVHVHNATSLQYGVLSRFVSRARVVVTLHGDLDTQARIGTALEWSLTSASVAVSAAAARSLHLPRSASPLTVVHNGIAVPPARGEKRVQTRAMLGVGQKLVGIIVARIDSRKGHHTLLHSLQRLCASEPGTVHVLIAGHGQERTRMEQLARSLGLDRDQVTFLGARTDIDDLLDAADFFVLPSDTEGLPLSILEAMVHGLPIVASRVGGIPEIVDDEQEGLLVPPGDASALAGAMARLGADPTFRETLGRNARMRAETALSLDQTVRNYGEVYRGALRGIRGG